MAYLAADTSSHAMKTGRTLMTIDLAHEYHFKEDDGTMPGNKFTVKNMLTKMNHPWLAAMFPEHLKMPKTLLHMASFKF